jgi:hypothetical protein
MSDPDETATEAPTGAAADAQAEILAAMDGSTLEEAQDEPTAEADAPEDEAAPEDGAAPEGEAAPEA